MTYPLKKGDILVQTTCGWCLGPVDLRYIGKADPDDPEKRQKLIYYRNLEFDEVPITWNISKPARYLPFCSCDCGTRHYNEKVLKKETADMAQTTK
jgi:hypothetical protein